MCILCVRYGTKQEWAREDSPVEIRSPEGMPVGFDSPETRQCWTYVALVNVNQQHVADFLDVNTDLPPDMWPEWFAKAAAWAMQTKMLQQLTGKGDVDLGNLLAG